MPRLSTPILALVWLVAPSAFGDDPAKDKETIQGTWLLTSVEIGGRKAPQEYIEEAERRLEFAGDKFTLKEGKKTVAQGTFRLDPTKTPKHYNSSHEDGRRTKG